jgi:uncharacterized protein (TIGR02145 family)
MKAGNIAVLVAFFMLFATCADAVYVDCSGGGRYEDNTDGTVTDCRTGLIWLKNARCTGTSNTIYNQYGDLTWHDAQKWVAGLYADGSGTAICGLSDGSAPGDWRLPTKTEWMAMVAYAKMQHYTTTNLTLTNDAGNAQWSTATGSSFTGVQSSGYWSSTTVAGNPGSAWYINISFGNMPSYQKSQGSLNVWPVRGGQSGSIGSLRIE